MLHSKIESRLLLLSALALSVAFLALGCNRGGGESVAEGSRTQGGGVAARPASSAALATSTPEATGEPVETPLEAESTPRGNDTEVTPAEFLAPDVATPETERLVTPGSVVEITAEASSDVVEMELSDGLAKATLFVHDADAGIWRASYRVPLRLKGDRLGLSVTAKNGGGKFRRVWVFLKDSRAAAAVDSSSG